MKFPLDCNLLQQKSTCKDYRPWSLASHCYSHRWLTVANRLQHYVNMAVRVTLCFFFSLQIKSKTCNCSGRVSQMFASESEGHPPLLDLL